MKTTSEPNPRFLGEEFPLYPAEKAFFHILPAPLEMSVSYGGGTARGPRALIEASSQLETYDGFSVPGELGIFTASPLIFPESPAETGSISESRNRTLETAVRSIEQRVEETLNLGKFPVLLGGEHTVSVGALQAFSKRWNSTGNSHSGNTRIGVIQFDAHADLKDSYEGSIFSHACVMRRAVDLDIPIFQVGIRSLTEEEDSFRKGRNIRGVDAADLASGRIPSPLLPEDFPEDVYITIDVDGFDPSVIPATGTPEPGGFSWYLFFDIVWRIFCERNLVGFDVVELAPIHGLHYPEFTCARLVYNLMGMVQRQGIGEIK